MELRDLISRLARANELLEYQKTAIDDGLLTMAERSRRLAAITEAQQGINYVLALRDELQPLLDKANKFQVTGKRPTL